MKKLIRIQLLTFAAIITSILSYGQSGGKFYSTFENFKNDQPMAGYEIEEGSWSMTLGSESVKLKTADGTERKNVSKLPAELFTYGDNLMRGYDGKVWLVLVAGKMSYYAKKVANEDQGYSEGITGEIIKFKDSAFEKILEQYGLLEAYENDKPKREKKDSVNDYFNKRVSRKIKYFKLINEKMK
jgi:hypothetical protein